MLAKSITAIVALTTASAAAAQWVPGMEITGQQVQVQTNGVTNVITFEPNGVAHISSPTGATVVDATWTTNAGKLCLQSSTGFDCYPYAAPFTANVPVDLRSDCNVLSRWMALSTATPPGERG
jgi:hypothetical protein